MRRIKDLRPGDPIKHKNNSLGYCTDAIIVRESSRNPDHWVVSYTNKIGVATQGQWLKIKCVTREKLTPQQQGLPKPDINKYGVKSNGSPELKYFQALYSWRGYNGCGHKYKNTHYDQSSAIGVKTHQVIDQDFTKLENISQEYSKQSINKMHGVDWFPPVTNRHKPEKTMKSEITEVFVNGVLIQTAVNDKDINNMVPSDFLCQIGNAEEAIKKLSKHTENSIFAVQESKRLQIFVASLYVLLDKKHATDATPGKKA